MSPSAAGEQAVPLGTGMATALAYKRLRAGPGVEAATGRSAVVRAADVPGTIVNRSPADGSVLVAGSHVSIDSVKAMAPAGSKVFEEQWYRLQRARPWLANGAALKAPRASAATSANWSVVVRVADGAGTRLRDALVTAMVDEARGIGHEAKTDRFGRVRFGFSARVKRLDVVYVDPLYGGWPTVVRDVEVADGELIVEAPPLELDAADVRGLVYGAARTASGARVKVGVVDTGIGRHDALTLAGGRNTTEESPRRFRDEDGHGSHVAGVIAAKAAGWRRGEASAVALYAYRIFEAGADEASTFAIAAAIKQAALDGCDLINLSIGGGPADGAVEDAIDQAWQLGCVCVAATGNDGGSQVDYPARYAKCIAVSAIGLMDSWPAEAAVDWTLSRWAGKALAGRDSFLASFSNQGAKVVLTAPGVAVLSTIFDNRWGVMSGTSMATPVATGVLARRLTASAVLAMPRNAARAAAIVALAQDHAEDLRLHPRMQGKGLAR